MYLKHHFLLNDITSDPKTSRDPDRLKDVSVKDVSVKDAQEQKRLGQLL